MSAKVLVFKSIQVYSEHYVNQLAIIYESADCR